MSRVAINGLGRIGRTVLRIVEETPELELVAVNDSTPVWNLAYLMRYDSVYGRHRRGVSRQDDDLVIGDRVVRTLTSTGATAATIDVLPQYAGHFDGLAVRWPVPVGSLVDLTQTRVVDGDR